MKLFPKMKIMPKMKVMPSMRQLTGMKKSDIWSMPSMMPKRGKTSLRKMLKDV